MSLNSNSVEAADNSVVLFKDESATDYASEEKLFPSSAFKPDNYRGSYDSLKGQNDPKAEDHILILSGADSRQTQMKLHSSMFSSDKQKSGNSTLLGFRNALQSQGQIVLKPPFTINEY